MVAVLVLTLVAWVVTVTLYVPFDSDVIEAQRGARPGAAGSVRPPADHAAAVPPPPAPPRRPKQPHPKEKPPATPLGPDPLECEALDPPFSEVLHDRGAAGGSGVRLRVRCEEALGGSGAAVMFGDSAERVPYKGVPLPFPDGVETAVAVCAVPPPAHSNGTRAPRSRGEVFNTHMVSRVRPELLRDAAMRRSRVEMAWRERAPRPTSGRAAAPAAAATSSGRDDDDRASLMAGFNVLALEMDAVSRAEYARHLVQTDAELAAIGSGPGSLYRVFNFSHFNVMGYDSMENFPALYGGFRWTWWKKQFHDAAPSDDPDERWEWRAGHARNMTGAGGRHQTPDEWVWHAFRRHGFVTLHGEEICARSHIARAFFGGAPPPADITPGAAFCHAGYCCCCANEPDDDRRLCAGGRAAFRRSLEYLLDFQRGYERVGRFATYNLLVAHEPTRERLSMLDAPLRAFVRSMLLGARHESPGVEPPRQPAARPKNVLALLSDHGLQYGEHSQTDRGQREHKNPPLLLAVPRWLLALHPEAERALERNQDRLVTHLDVYRTLASLPLFPGTARGPPWSFNLLAQEVPAMRNCDQARVPGGFCARTDWIRVQHSGLSRHVRDAAGTAPLLVAVAREAVARVNAATARSRDGYARVCRPLALLAVAGASRTELKGQRRSRDGQYLGQLTYDVFKVQAVAVRADAYGEHAARRDEAEAEGREYQPASSAAASRDTVTLEALVSLPRDPDDPGAIVFDSDTVEFRSISRLSKRAVHEACMRARDPEIPHAFCVCDVG